MNQNKPILLFAILLLNLNAFAQKRLDNLRSNSNFEWVVDSLDMNLTLYYERNTYAEKHIDVLKIRIKNHLTSTLNFIGVDGYGKPIHYFILEDRERMKVLVGYETNGNANPKHNFLTAIFSENIKAAYSNHELFHLIAMNLWGYPETWINEGMAVYADNSWNGYNLHELSKFLIDNDKFVSIDSIAKDLRKYDSMLTYPLLGSFAKFIDETYGRETIEAIWIKGRKGLKKHVGRSLDDLQKEWLFMLKSVSYNDIQYLN